MAQDNYIRECRDKEGLTIAEISRRTGVSWPTAKKYADSEVLFQCKPKRRRGCPKMDDFEEYVVAWLEEDSRQRKEQRRTARSIFKQLKGIDGFSASERTVRDYVSKKRSELKGRLKQRDEQFIRLEHPSGEAQVDFGEFDAIDVQADQTIRAYHLVMSFPNSNGRFARALPAQNSECLFTGLMSIFNELGGVPPYILFDNLTPVVNKIVSNTKRKLTDMFVDFSRKYRFDYRFCNPGKGNEKGHVEGSVGYVRRNFLTPLQVIDDYAEFNDRLIADLREDRKELHYEKQQPISVLWKEDEAQLLALPVTPFAAIRAATGTINKYNEIAVGGEVYHVPKGHHRQRVFIKLYWDKLEIFDQYGETKIGENPRQYAFKTKAVEWAAELEIYRNKPRAIEQATYLKALPKVVKEYLLPPSLNERRKRVSNVITLLEKQSILDVAVTIQKGVDYGTTDLASLVMLSGYCTASNTPSPIAEPWTPASVVEWKPDLSAYDYLTPRGDVHE